MRLQHGWLELLLIMLDPARSRPEGVTVAGAATAMARVSGLLFFGGALLTFFVLAVGLTTWRASQREAPHQLLVWSSRIALVFVLAGSAWHATTLHATRDPFQQILDRPGVVRQQ